MARRYEPVRQRKDGRRVQIDLTVSPIQDAAGLVVGASKIARDISSRKRAEDTQTALYHFTDRLFHAGSASDIYEAALDLHVPTTLRGFHAESADRCNYVPVKVKGKDRGDT